MAMLIPFTLISLLHVTTLMASTPEITTMDNPWGVLMIPGEPTALHSATWKLCLVIDTKTLETNLRDIEEQWTVDVTFQKRLLKHPTGIDLAPTIKDALRKAKAEYQRLRFRMRARLPTNKKRAAPVIGETGTFLSYLFGIAATDDTDRLQMEINALVNRQTALVNVQSKQLSTFRVMESALLKQQQQINSQVNATKLLFHTVVKLYLEHFGPNTTQRGEHIQWQHQFLHSIDLFHDTVMDHHHAIDRAEEGFLSPTILPTTQLTSALKNITKALPDDLNLPVSKENLPDYYETRLCGFLPLNDTMMVIMDIPLINRSELYTPYQVTPFPSTTTPPVTLVTDVIRVYVNQQGNRFVAYDKRDPLPTCLFARPRVCDVNGKFIHTAPKDCISNIIAFDLTKGNGLFPHALCHFAPTDDLPDAVTRVTPSRWAIYTNETVNVDFQCPNMTIPTISIIKHHMITLPPNCSATVGDILLPLRLQGETLLTTTSADLPPVPMRPPPFRPQPDVFGKQLMDAFARHLHDADHGKLNSALNHLKNATIELNKSDVSMVNERL